MVAIAGNGLVLLSDVVLAAAQMNKGKWLRLNYCQPII